MFIITQAQLKNEKWEIIVEFYDIYHMRDHNWHVHKFKTFFPYR